jgi:hypothetical protein
MDDVTQTPGAHAKPAARHDHLWVLFTIAACVLAEVWASWVGIGSISGFPRIDGVPTDWVLAVAMEAYWGYALYAWLVASPGPRSRAMAMWSCAVVFLMSLTGQILYHELTAAPSTPPGRRVVIAFSTSLPVIVLALIAVLIHLRHADRAEADQVAESAELAERQAATERAEADERTALRAEAEASRVAREEAVADLDTARAELSAAVMKAEALTRKLETATGRKRGAATGRKRGTVTGRKQSPVTPAATASLSPEAAGMDLDTEALVLKYIGEGHSASEAGVMAGVTDGRGRQIARLAKAKKEPAGDDRSDGDMATGEQPRVSEES